MLLRIRVRAMWESLKGTPKNRKKKLNRGVRGEMVSSARVLIEVPVRVNGSSD